MRSFKAPADLSLLDFKCFAHTSLRAKSASFLEPLWTCEQFTELRAGSYSAALSEPCPGEDPLRI